MILVSACLVGVNCRYDCGNSLNNELVEFLKDKEYKLVCPEQLGGLSSPRHPSEIIMGDGIDVLKGVGKVVDIEGKDVTESFKTGGEKTLSIALEHQATTAILKARSPSCGSQRIYSGEFNGSLKKGVGVATAMLLDKGIQVLSEENYNEILVRKKGE